MRFNLTVGRDWQDLPNDWTNPRHVGADFADLLLMGLLLALY